MATVAIVLKTTKKLLNDEYAVAIRVTHEREPRYITLNSLVTNQSLKFRSRREDWKPAEPEDNGLGKFKRTFPAYKECNAILETKLVEAKKILERYERDGIPYSFNQFETDIKSKDKLIGDSSRTSKSVFNYYTEQIKLLEEQGREGIAGLYRENQSILNKFRPTAGLAEVNFRFLESFEYWMRNERGNKDTTISVKMRNLQRVINQAIEDKLFKKDDYPFGEKKYSVNKRLDHTTKKIAITLDKVGKLKALSLEPGTTLRLARELALFSYYCRGMNFIDMTYLKWKDISDTHICYVRKKTRGKFNIPLNEHNLSILTYFKENYCAKGDYVFPILDPEIHVTLKQQYTRKKTALKAVNDNLKKLAVMIGEKTLKLSTNVLRHSYATGLKRSGANTSYITEALGHATQEQTQTYLAEFEEGEITTWENKMFNS
ncbi:MAG TPA: site-specific integrase [Mucilaginibacter sp.]|jgi:site-specific recombinase XerD